VELQSRAISYLCGEQLPVHRVLGPPGVALPPVEVELTEPELVFQGAPFQRCAVAGGSEKEKKTKKNLVFSDSETIWIYSLTFLVCITLYLNEPSIVCVEIRCKQFMG